MEFFKVTGHGFEYWVWLDEDYLPYIRPTEKDIKDAPKPLLLRDIPPEWPIGFETTDPDSFTNVIPLKNSFDELKIDSDLKKDLKRVEKKNENTKIILNEPNALEKSKEWFLEQWKENAADFKQRTDLWKKNAYTLSAYSGNTLLAVHIAIAEKDSVYYLGCWWDRNYKNLSVPTFLLKKDIENAIEKKLKFYDLGVGTEPYKKKWGVISKPAKYYAVLTKEIAKKLEIEKFVEIK
ncbi:MAG TPA: GNAT family N-acetyltransferase [archaeon]|nr:GNAT family N-acetyltransferase [archaeon]